MELEKINYSYTDQIFIYDIVHISTQSISADSILTSLALKTCKHFEIDEILIYETDNVNLKNDFQIARKFEMKGEEIELSYSNKQDNKRVKKIFDLICFNDYSVVEDTNLLCNELKHFFIENSIRAYNLIPLRIMNRNDGRIIFITKYLKKDWTEIERQILELVGNIIESVLARKEINIKLEASYKSMSIIFNNLNEAICVVRPETFEIIFANDAMKKYITGKSVKNFFENNDDVAENNCNEIYYPHLEAWVKKEHVLTEWIDGSDVILITLTDITSNKESELKIRNMVYNDCLLDMPNRLQFYEDINSIFERKGSGAILFFDIDNFKNINDCYGHHVGDLFLRNFRDFLFSLEIKKGGVYRFGGDEFVAILDGYTKIETECVCNAILERFKVPWELGGLECYCTASIGVSLYPEDGPNPEEIVKSADMAMFKSKELGKNKVYFFSDKLNYSYKKRAEIEKHIVKQVKDNFSEFALYYQPIIDTTSQKCIGAEALLRWDSKEIGMVCPNEFIPLADYLGLIVPIGNWVIDTACKKCEELTNKLNYNFVMHINVSNKQVQSDGFIDSLKAAISKYNIPEKSLVIEINRSFDERNWDMIKDLFEEIKNIGVEISMNESDMGHSLIKYFEDMKIDEVKIDKLFTQNMINHLGHSEFVKSITGFSLAMGKKVCAVGVETKEQYNILKEIGNITNVQGYYFSKPMEQEKFDKWLFKL